MLRDRTRLFLVIDPHYFFQRQTLFQSRKASLHIIYAATRIITFFSYHTREVTRVPQDAHTRGAQAPSVPFPLSSVADRVSVAHLLKHVTYVPTNGHEMIPYPLSLILS